MSIRFIVDPKDIPPEKAARRLGLTIDRFQDILPRLLSRGFPPSDPDTGNFDLDAIDEWRSSRHKTTVSKITAKDTSIGLVSSRLERMGG